MGKNESEEKLGWLGEGFLLVKKITRISIYKPVISNLKSSN